ncbi:hypothetical protein AB4Z21_08795 [Paenibacillus sp. MCAF20]
MTPFAPMVMADLKDTFIRVPLWLMKERPQRIKSNNKVRQQVDPEPRKEPGQ